MISKRHLTRRPYCAALVPAAGKSGRMGGTDKLTAQLGGIPVLERTLLALDGASLVDEIVVAVSPERLEELAALCARVGVKKPLRVVEGGASRAQSVLLAALAASEGCELLAVHDGARPLILPEQVDEMVRLGRQTYAAAPALPVTDSYSEGGGHGGAGAVPPDHQDAVRGADTAGVSGQHPQGGAAIGRKAGAELTDDCSAVERLGKEVYLAPGWRENIKITTASDLTLAEALLRERENRA